MAAPCHALALRPDPEPPRGMILSSEETLRGVTPARALAEGLQAHAGATLLLADLDVMDRVGAVLVAMRVREGELPTLGRVLQQPRRAWPNWRLVADRNRISVRHLLADGGAALLEAIDIARTGVWPRSRVAAAASGPYQLPVRARPPAPAAHPPLSPEVMRAALQKVRIDAGKRADERAREVAAACETRAAEAACG